MLFNSYIFVLVFLPLVIALWWALPRTGSLRIAMLVAASYLFYGWWDWRFLGLMLLSTLIDYIAGGQVAASATAAKRRAWLLVSVSSNLSLLGVFKYAGFAATSWNALAAWLHTGGPVPVPEIILPVGISFYTFQTMSYAIDVYQGHAKPAPSLLHFAAYVSMFPQLVAGPIVRYADVDEQLRSLQRPFETGQFAAGLWFFALGMAQKVLLADPIAGKIEPLFEQTATLQGFGAWTAMLGYSCQLYFDFAGYSNMAVGLGRMLGFEFCQNFDSPYQSPSLQDFWRRWHMSLSTMLRDYLFIPLGGNRGGTILTLRNLLLVMLIGGIWHGAGWTFVLWGIYHGVLLGVNFLWRQWGKVKLAPNFAIAITFFTVVAGWVLFRSDSLATAGSLYSAMLGLRGWEAAPLAAVGGKGVVLLLGILLGIAFLAPNLWRQRFVPNAWTGALAALVLLLCVLRFDAVSPFLYFQF